VATKPACVHCKRKQGTRQGGLCTVCYEDTALREAYPPRRGNPVKKVRLEDITFDRAMQMRAGGTDPTALEEYTEAYKNGEDLPAIILFADDATDTLWCADGFTRSEAAQDAGLEEILAEVRVGSRRDALLYAAGANHGHGKGRTKEDKRKAVLSLLNDPEWSAWSAYKIANVCNVSHTFVDNLKKTTPPPAVTCISASETSAEDVPGEAHLATLLDSPPTETPGGEVKAERNGTVYTVNTANIGKGKKKESAPKDDTGAEIPSPSAAADTFAERPRYKAAIASLEKLLEAGAEFVKDSDALMNVARYYPFLLADDFQNYRQEGIDLASLGLLLETFRAGLPYAVCPDCGGKGCAKDRGCRGGGHIPKRRWLDLHPEEEAA
jgi:hypothetical protein